MSRVNRRSFLKSSLATGLVFAVGSTRNGKVLGANDTIRIGVAGINGRGKSHINGFGKQENVDVIYLIDPDSRLFDSRIKLAEEAGGVTPKAVQDIRKALEDKNLDAVSIAAPNHWHSLITIWACEAGKDVYVEKPCSHNPHEGRIAVETARKHNSIVQHGTQSRSSMAWARAAEIARQGKYGKLLVSRGLCYKNRPSIGVKENATPPVELDFNLWLGPASDQPYHANLVHYNWHWFWDFGNGDIGNQGVHQMDIARWMIPGAILPKSVVCLGGRFGYTDQGQTTNTQVALMDFGESTLIFEVRGLPSSPYYGEGIGNLLHFEAGVLSGSNKFYPKGSDQPVDVVRVEASRGPGDGHFENFIAAMRSRKTSDLNADILEGHFSAALCHLANISYRLGKDVAFTGGAKPFGKDKDANESFARMEEHLQKGNNLKLEETQYRMGRLLTFDAKAEQFVNDNEANALLTRAYRSPFSVPEKVV